MWPQLRNVASMAASPFRYFKTSPEIIRLAVMLYVRLPLSLRNVEDVLHERGIDVSHETVRYWRNRFGPIFAAEIRRKEAPHAPSIMKAKSSKPMLRSLCYQAARSQGSVSAQSDETVWPAECNRHRQTLAHIGSAENDWLRRVLGDRPLAEQSGGKLPPAAQTTRRGNATLSADGNASEICGHSFIRTQSFQSERHLYSRENFKLNRSAALAEWRELSAA